MSKKPNNVDEYIANAPEWAKDTLRSLRQTIISAAPDAKESISYRMPYYSQNRRLAYFAAYKNHCSFHWISDDDKKVFEKDLKKLEVVGSTLRIPKGTKVPTEIIKKIVKSRVKKSERR